MQLNNTVNELRGKFKMSDNDIRDFLQFTTKPKEQVGLNNLVKLWQMQGGQSVANNDTMEAVNAARQAPRSAGVSCLVTIKKELSAGPLPGEMTHPRPLIIQDLRFGLFF